jgi:hypothetical protein
MAGSGCVGMSGQRYYDEKGKTSRGLEEIVDCPTCPSGERSQGAVVHAAPRRAGDDSIIPPHAKFHPVPTRPVFAPKVMPASATVEVLPTRAPALAVAAAPNPAAKPVPAIDNDEAPAPPVTLAVAKPAAQPSSRSVLRQNEPRRLAEDTMASVLVASKPAQPTLLDAADAEPSPTLAEPELAAEPKIAAMPTPAKKTTAAVAPTTTRSAGDGWRPRVGN